jgi:hypothetical protein
MALSRNYSNKEDPRSFGTPIIKHDWVKSDTYYNIYLATTSKITDLDLY